MSVQASRSSGRHRSAVLEHLLRPGVHAEERRAARPRVCRAPGAEHRGKEPAEVRAELDPVAQQGDSLGRAGWGWQGGSVGRPARTHRARIGSPRLRSSLPSSAPPGSPGAAPRRVPWSWCSASASRGSGLAARGLHARRSTGARRMAGPREETDHVPEQGDRALGGRAAWEPRPPRWSAPRRRGRCSPRRDADLGIVGNDAVNPDPEDRQHDHEEPDRRKGGDHPNSGSPR